MPVEPFETLPLQTCDGGGCYAGNVVSPELLGALKQGTTLSITRLDGELLIVDANGLVPGDCDGDTLLNEGDALPQSAASVYSLVPLILGADLLDQ